LRVLLTTDYYPPHHGGGAESTLPVAARYLAGRGHSVDVVTLGSDGGGLREDCEGVTVHHVPSFAMEKWLGLQFAVSLGLFRRMGLLISDVEPDVVWAHNHFFTTSLAAHWAARSKRIPVITDLSVADVDHLPLRYRLPAEAWEQSAARWMLGRSVALSGVSEAAIRHGRKLLGARAEGMPAWVVPNGVDTEVFRPAEAEPTQVTIGFVGRLISNKGPQRLVEAIPRVLEEQPNARFVFIGDGPLRGDLEERVRTLKVTPSVEFRGSLPHEEIPEALRSLTMVVRPSDTEGLPVIALEAMASGLPVIATDVGGTREVVQDGVTGVLLPPRPSPGVIADAILSVARDDRLRSTMRSASRLAAEGLTWSRCLEQREELLTTYARSSS